MNGTWKNWAAHFCVGAGLAVISGFSLGTVAGGVIAAVWFYAKEAGERSKEFDVRADGRTIWESRNALTDLAFWGRRWTTDDRLDLASGISGGVAGAYLVSLI